MQIRRNCKHVSLVISPLNALMNDQVDKWKDTSLKCIAIHSEGDKATGSQLKAYDVIFTNPENAVSPQFKQKVKENLQGSVCVVAFDEAHCLTEWGLTSFRSEYANLTDLLAVIPEAPVLVMTGTMSPEMRTNTMNNLQIYAYKTVAISPDRPDIYIGYDTADRNNFQWLFDDLATQGNQCDKTIIYCRTVGEVTATFGEFLDKLGPRIYCNGDKTVIENRLVDQYSSVIAESSKRRILKLFSIPSNLRVVIATLAFGMGIDIPDIRHILIWGYPETICHYWQELGRASRDAQGGRCIFYPAFVPGTIKCSDALRTVISRISEPNTCLRLKILQHLWLPEMGDLPPMKDRCNGSCSKCDCASCTCCHTCKQACPCTTSAASQ